MLRKTLALFGVVLSSFSTLCAATSSSQIIAITLVGESLINLELPRLEVLFASTDGLIQEKTVTSPYQLINIGAPIDVVGKLDALPTGIVILATMGIPSNSFSDVQPSSIPNVALSTEDQLSLQGVHKQYGRGQVSYRVQCDFNSATVSQIQDYPVTVTYTLQAATPSGG